MRNSVCSDAQMKPHEEISDLYDSYNTPPLTNDWAVPKAAIEAASYDVTYGLQTGSIGIAEPAPNFSETAVIDGEITECVFQHTSLSSTIVAMAQRGTDWLSTWHAICILCSTCGGCSSSDL